MQLFRLCESKHIVLFRHTKAELSVVWREQQSGPSWHCGHCRCGRVLDVICMVVSDDAQANASIHFQISTGMGLVKSLALYVLQLLSRFPSLTKQVLLSQHAYEHLTFAWHELLH